MHVTSERLGTLYGLGVGPGDPEYITVKALRLLQAAPVLAYPQRRMGSKSYALTVAEHYVNLEEKEALGLVFPMTRDPEVLRRQWQAVVDAVWAPLQAGRDVAFVTEGDPLLYSTFIHMSRLLMQQHPEARVVPVAGVSSVFAAAAAFQLPLADGDETVAIVPATHDRTKMRAMLTTHDCVIFIKVAKVLDELLDLLEELGLTDKAVVGTRISSDEQLLWRDVRALRGADLNYLTILVVRT
ncbi:MAG: precorrin-2 C(20)-methyltransferase [Alicyclobacillus sp.]|nr:precorrin-2 C(20)-methyltransferase [Alicyclobacillus sp.]